MASEGGIRAGKAYVELFADDSRLTQNMAAAEAKVRGFGNTVEDIHVNKVGKSITKTGKAMSSMGKALGDTTHSMSMIGTESKAIGASMMVMNGLMSGPTGWIGLLVAGAGIAALELLKVRQHLDYTSDSVKKLAEGLKEIKWPELSGRMATVGRESGKIEISKEYGTAVSQHKEAMQKLADADADYQVSKEAVAIVEDQYTAALARQEKALAKRAAYEAGYAATPRQTQEMTKAEYKAMYKEEVAAAKALQQAELHLQSARAEALPVQAAMATAREREERATAEMAKLAPQEMDKGKGDFVAEQERHRQAMEAETTQQEEVEARRLHDLNLGLDQELQRLQIENIEDEFRREWELTELSYRHKIEAAEKAGTDISMVEAAREQALNNLTVRRERKLADEQFEIEETAARKAVETQAELQDQIARLKIESDPGLLLRPRQKKRMLMELEHEQELRKAREAGMEPDNIAMLRERQALEERLLDLHVPKQTTAGTFSAFAAARMGGATEQQRIALANERQVKLQERIAAAVEHPPALALR